MRSIHLTDFLDNLASSAPSQQIRESVVRKTYLEMAAKDKSMLPLSPLASRGNQFMWKLNIGARKVTVTIPQNGEDGAYVVNIDGRPMELISRGIDRYSRQFQFHRISANDEALSFTIEWKGSPPEDDATSLMFFLKTLLMLL